MIPPTEPLSAPSKPALARVVATASVLAALTLLLYNLQRDSLPLNPDEVAFSRQVNTVGNARPLFFRVAEDRWLQPVAVYVSAALRAAGGGEQSGRMAGTIAGAINVALVYVIVRLIAAEWSAIGAALLLLATPAHWWFARLGTDAIFPAPFVLLWMLAMLRFIQFDSPRTLAFAGAALGAGIYTHPTAPTLMTWLWIVTVVALVAWRRLAVRNLTAIALGFGLFLVPAVVWFMNHPDTYNDTFGRWAIFKAHIRFPLQGLQAQMNWNTVGVRASIFWGLLDPSVLLFASDEHAIAPLLIGFVVLLALGIGRLMTVAQPSQRIVLVAAALLPVLVASTFGQAHDLSMVTAMTGAAAVLVGVGLDSLKMQSRYWIAITAVAIAVSAYQLVSYQL